MTDQATKQVPPLLPDHARRPAAIVAVCCAVVLAAGGAAAAGRSEGTALDRSIDSWIIGHLHGHVSAGSRIAYLGSEVPVTALAVIVILGCLAVRRLNGAFLALIAIPVASGLTEYALKPIVHETIGHPGVLSYPSGHTTSVFTLVTIAAVLLIDPARGRLSGWLRLALATMAVLVGCAVAVSLVVIHFHYFTDTIGGACVAIDVVLVTALLLDMPAARARMGRWTFRSGR